MHLFLSTFKLSLLLLSPLFQTLIIGAPAPAPAPAPILLALRGSEDNSPSPIKFLPNYSSSAAVHDDIGNTLIYYQTSDGAIHELKGYGYPQSINPYTDSVLLKPGQARKGSPLAAASLAKGYDLRLYYISPNNQLKEYKYGDGYWYSGTLDAENIFVKPDSQILWAVSTLLGYDPSVGYVAPNGDLSAAIYYRGWSTTIF